VGLHCTSIRFLLIKETEKNDQTTNQPSTKTANVYDE
jgi:hypothetical protein